MLEKIDVIWVAKQVENPDETHTIMNEYTSVENCISYVQQKFDKEVSDRTIQRWARDSEIVEAVKVGSTIMIDYMTIYDFCRKVKRWQPVKNA